MSTASGTKTAIPKGTDARVLARIIEEGYGPGAWHGPDLKTALGGVSPELALWRPTPGRHNIAEIVLHHAYYIRSVRGRLSGTPPEPFVLEGDDWFAVSEGSRLGWPEIQELVDEEQRRLAALVSDIATGRIRPPLPEAESFELVLGITCHAVYHAGQVQLIRRLHAE